MIYIYIYIYVVYDLYSTALNCVVMCCFTYITISDSELRQSSTYHNSQRNIQHMMPLKAQTVTQTHSHYILSGSHFMDE